MNNSKRLTKESLRENKRFTSLIVLAIMIIAIVFSIFVKLSRDAQIASIMKEINASSQNTSSNESVNSSGESKIEKLLRMSKSVNSIGNNISDLKIEAKVGFNQTDTGLKIDLSL
ncbi:MAG: hypothetical protein WCK31_00040 [bacterium]